MCVFFVALSCHLDINSVYLSPENYGSDISEKKKTKKTKVFKIIDLLNFYFLKRMLSV